MPIDVSTRLARAVLRARLSRATHLPSALFGGEQPWDLLLALFVADAEGRRLTGEEVIAETRGSRAAGRRWIQVLTQAVLIVGDGEGHLGDTLTLTPDGLHAMERWLEEAASVLELRHR